MPPISKNEYDLLKHRSELYEEARRQCDVFESAATAANREMSEAQERVKELTKALAVSDKVHDDLLSLYGKEVHRAMLAESSLKGEKLFSEMQRLCLRDEYTRYANLKILTDDVIAEKDKKIAELNQAVQDMTGNVIDAAQRMGLVVPAEIPNCLKPLDAIEYAGKQPGNVVDFNLLHKQIYDIPTNTPPKGLFDRLMKALLWGR